MWIFNKGGHNYDPAKEFGTLVSLTSGTVNHFNVDRLAMTMATTISGADKEDYLLISGAPMINAIALFLWLRRFKKAKTLQFSIKEEQYIPRVLYDSTLTELVTQAR